MATSAAQDRPVILVVAAVIARSDGRILAMQRLEGGAAANKWEFPGGKVHSDETPEQALARELKEELELELPIGTLLGEFATPVNGRTIRLRCYWVRYETGMIHMHAHQAMRWCGISELDTLDFAEPDLPAIEAIKATV